jgi:hypothetical protein
MWVEATEHGNVGCAFAHCTCKSSGMSSIRISRRVKAPRAAVYQALAKSSARNQPTILRPCFSISTLNEILALASDTAAEDEKRRTSERLAGLRLHWTEATGIYRFSQSSKSSCNTSDRSRPSSSA